MLALNINQSDIDYLSYERYSYPDVLVQKRFHVIYLKATTSYTHQAIAAIVGVHRDSLTHYIHLYNQSGIDGLRQVNYGSNRSILDQHHRSLLAYFESHPPISSGQACQVIEAQTGIKRSPTQVRKWFHRHGLQFQKAGQIPAKADPQAQASFLTQQLQPLIAAAQQEKIHLLFLDAAHFVMGVFLCAVWCIKRVFIKSAAGRKRYNVLGAINAMTQQIHTWTNQDYINAQSIIDFLAQLRNYYQDGKPIYIVLDNARYQRCQLVQYMAWFLNIHLVFLPPYSPNLNLIERLWKWTKKKCLYAQYYETFQEFKDSIDKVLKKANNEYKQEIESLMTLSFQQF